MRENFPVTPNEHDFPEVQTLLSVTHLQGRITGCNSHFVAVSGSGRDPLLGPAHPLARHPDMVSEAFRGMWATRSSGQPWSGLVKNRRKAGDPCWVLAQATPMRDGKRITGDRSVRSPPPTRRQVRVVSAQAL